MEHQSGADIVIPVFEAAEVLGPCLESVIEHTDLERHQLILVVDGPQSAAVEDILTAPTIEGCGAELLRNAERGGFVVSANRGLSHTRRDVILLNSDTIVTSGWADKLLEAAGSHPKVATVTPFSNNATLCSLPEPWRENLLPVGHNAESFGQLIDRRSVREYPQLPTGVGVCLLVTRQAIDAVGLFDEERFGLGYGEETDFCLRARARGFIHLLDDATFVFHHGRRSFTTSSTDREQAAMRLVRRRHPDYFRELAAFMKEDPLDRIRRRAIDAPSPSPTTRRSILHVVHGWPPWATGGTELYAKWLAQAHSSQYRIAVFARTADPGSESGFTRALLDDTTRCRFVVNNFDARNPISRNAFHNRRFNTAFLDFARDVKPDLIHVHHLAGGSATLMGAARGIGVPLVYQVQDWWPRCARANLWRADDRLCSGPTPLRCSRCLPLTGLFPRTVLNPALHLIRDFVLKRQLTQADAYIMGSETIRAWYERHGGFAPGVPVYVIPYGIPGEDRPAVKEPAQLPLRVGIIATVMPHKGLHVAVEAFASLSKHQAQLDIWGDETAQPEYRALLGKLAGDGPIQFHGRFDEAEKADILSGLDLLLVPSVGLESFGIIAREAMHYGTPVLASRLGALEELEIEARCGAFIEAGSVCDLRSWLNRLIAQPAIIDTWRRALTPQTSTTDHASEIGAVYEELWAR